MTRLRRVPLRIGPEHLVCQLFLLLGHRVVEVVEGRDQLLQMLDVCFGHLLVGLHVLHRVHCRVLLSALQESLIHIAGVFAHDLGELIPLRLLGRRDLQLRVKLFDMVLDSFLHVLPGTGWEVIGEDAAAGGAAGAGDWAGCASAAAGSASSATTAAEARWLDRIVFIGSFLGLMLSPIWKDVVGARAGPAGLGGQAAQ